MAIKVRVFATGDARAVADCFGGLVKRCGPKLKAWIVLDQAFDQCLQIGREALIAGLL